MSSLGKSTERVSWSRVAVGAGLAGSAPATAARSFAATDRVLVEIECRGPDGVAPQVKVDLLNQKGNLLRALDAPVLQDGRGRITLPVNALANSTYVLRIEAAAGEQAAQQWVAFKVTR